MTAAYPKLASEFILPCGHTLPNRFIKGAMTENMADSRNAPTGALIGLYERWGRGGCGALLTGNVMVDRRALEGPRNVAVEDERDMDALKQWAERAQAHGAQLWMQISHPGRQTPKGVSSLVISPTTEPVAGAFRPIIAKPSLITPEQIEDVVQRFAATADIAKHAGFAGVQIHSAHGYLLSQFLSPKTNTLDGHYGGNAEHRRRLLLEIVREVRVRVGEHYPISVKLNSADFQRGGFTEDESMDVVQALEEAGVDLLEISGGNYERPAMMASPDAMHKERPSTRAREGYFLEYAEKVRRRSGVPLMLTGGMRTPRIMEEILEGGAVDIIGVARPLAIDPDFCRKCIEGELETCPKVDLRTGIRNVDDLLQSLWHQEQFKLMGAGREPDLKIGKWTAIARGLYNIFGPK